MNIREVVNSQSSSALVTKQELVAALTRGPIVIEQVARLTYYRIAVHGAANGGKNSGVSESDVKVMEPHDRARDLRASGAMGAPRDTPAS